jgi:hypothetical protein
MAARLVGGISRSLPSRKLLFYFLLASLGPVFVGCGAGNNHNAASANRTSALSPENSNGTTPGAPTTPEAAPQKAHAAPASQGAIAVAIKNVDFHIQDSIVLRIRDLRGELQRRAKAITPTFDDKQSFVLKIDSGVIGISADSLTSVMNDYVFAYDHAPLKDISIAMDGNRIKLKGIMHKVVPVHVEVVGSLAATPDGKIRLHPDKIKADGIPVKGFMRLFGVELDELVKARESRGIKVDDDDLIMDPELILPPPAIRGNVTAVQVAENELVQVFGAGNESSERDAASSTHGPSYMRYTGGTLRFGKLTMADADLEIVGQDSKGPFDFSLDHYSSQLIAGYSKTTPSLGLMVFMPNYNKVQQNSQKVSGKAN